MSQAMIIVFKIM